jgi:hypothetical protein
VYRQNNALIFVGLCGAQHWNVPVPDLIRLLAGVLPSTDSNDLLLTSQIWKGVVYPKESIPEFHLAWWAYPGGSGRLTFDELEEVFEQFLLQVCHTVNLGIGISTIDTEFPEHDRMHTFG